MPCFQFKNMNFGRAAQQNGPVDTMGRRDMFSLCNFGSPYSRGVVASEIFILKLASFVI